LTNPHQQAEKPDKVRRMFAAIAGSYDLNNRLHSLWRDQAWRRYAVRAALVKPTDAVLDVACGTGDLTQAFAAAGCAKVTGLDSFTAEMLHIAEQNDVDWPPRMANESPTYRATPQNLPFLTHRLTSSRSPSASGTSPTPPKQWGSSSVSSGPGAGW